MRPWQSREGTSSSYKVPIKTYKPIASVAAFPAQPLGALPPYGCGVPLAGCERPAGWQYLRHKFIGAMPSSLSLRGGRRPTWQSRSTRPDHRKAIGENATAFPRLHPKGTSSRFALRAPRPRWGLAMTNLLTLRHRIRAAKPTACKALTPRKGDAASVRRQSRQRLRSDRRYRRNRCIPLLAARPFRWPLLRLPQTQMPKPGVRGGRILKFVTNFSFFPLDFLPEMGII